MHTERPRGDTSKGSFIRLLGTQDWSRLKKKGDSKFGQHSLYMGIRGEESLNTVYL
jgi:hypothetical protein